MATDEDIEKLLKAIGQGHSGPGPADTLRSYIQQLRLKRSARCAEYPNKMSDQELADAKYALTSGDSAQHDWVEDWGQKVFAHMEYLRQDAYSADLSLETASASNRRLFKENNELKAEAAKRAADEARGAMLASTRAKIEVEAYDSPADIIGALCDQLDDLKKQATQAAAELRHAYRGFFLWKVADWNLVSRAIQILEKAVS